MENAPLYTSANALQRAEARQVIQQFVQILPLKKGSRVLDVGCGSGDVTAEILLPCLPKDVKDVIGIDVSSKMITHAQQTYGNCRLSFSQMDIAEESELLINNNNPNLGKSVKALGNKVEILINGLKLTEEDEVNDSNVDKNETNTANNNNNGKGVRQISCKHQQFDVVFSFFCLHWIQNQRQALANMYSILKGGGEVLLVLLANSSIFDLYQRLAAISEWSPYMTDVDNFISPYYLSDDPVKEFSELATAVGFQPISVECRDRNFFYPNVDAVKEAIKAVNPFYPRLQKGQGDDFLTDCLSLVKKYNLAEPANNGLQVGYKLLVAHLRKPFIAT